MKKYVRKFRLLALSGAIVSIGAMTSIVAACGSTTPSGEGDEGEIVTYDFAAFEDDIMKNIAFEGVNGAGRVVDGTLGTTEIPNVILEYGWTETKDTQSSGTLTDYEQIQDLTNGYFFTIDMEVINGATFEGGAPSTIYVEVSGLKISQPFLDISPATLIVSKTSIDAFISGANKVAFEGVNGAGRVVDGTLSTTEIPNVILKYGWTETSSVPPSSTVTNYTTLVDMTNGYFFTIDMEEINGATFEGGAPSTIYIEISGLTNPIEFTELSESTKIISKNDVNSFITAATLGILFDGDDGSVYPMENSILNKGISNVTLKYGWTETKNAAPSATVNDYHLLTDMKNGYFFTIDFVVNENITFEGSIPPTLFIEVNTENNLNLAFAFIMNEYYNYYISVENQTPYVFNADGANIDDILGPLKDIYLNFLIDNIAVTVNNVGSLLWSLLEEFMNNQIDSFRPLFNELMAENEKFDGMWEGLILLGGWGAVAAFPWFGEPGFPGFPGLNN